MFRSCLAVFALAAALRAFLLWRFPVMPLGDGYTRLLDPEVLVKPPWLPGYQATLALTAWFTSEPQAFRIVTAAQGCAGAVATAWVCARYTGRARSGLAAGCLVALLPTFTLPSLAAYQEPLFLALLVPALYGLRRRNAAGAMLIALATTVRYEAWPIAVLGAVWLAWPALGGKGLDESGSSRPTAPLLLAAISIAGMAVVLVVYHDGLWPRFGAIDLQFSFTPLVERLRMLVGLGWSHGLFGLALLALLGLFEPAGWLLGLALFADCCWLAVLDPYSPANNPRQLILPALILTCLSAMSVSRWPRLSLVVLAAVAVQAVGQWQRALDGYAAGMPSVIATVGEAFRRQPIPGERVLVLATGLRDWPNAPVEECEVFAVHAGLPSARVICDSQVHPTDLSAGFGEWATSNQIGAVVRLGAFEDWRPVHEVFALMGDTWPAILNAPATVAVYAPPGSRRAETLATLAPQQLSIPDSHRCSGVRAEAIFPADTKVSGSATERSAARIALFSSGSVTIAATGQRASIWLCATPAEGRFPKIEMINGGNVRTIEADMTMRRFSVPNADAPVELRFQDDGRDKGGGDRNVYIGGLELE